MSSRWVLVRCYDAPIRWTREKKGIKNQEQCTTTIPVGDTKLRYHSYSIMLSRTVWSTVFVRVYEGTSAIAEQTKACGRWTIPTIRRPSSLQQYLSDTISYDTIESACGFTWLASVLFRPQYDSCIDRPTTRVKVVSTMTQNV
jgi:hypothetical protein